MPNKCCVPGCTTNYAGGEPAQVFKFPKEDCRRRKWISAIHRKNFTPTDNSVVCKKHFKESDFVTTSSCIDWKTGNTLTVPLKRHRLKEDAVPELLPNCPAYLSVSSSRREAPEARQERLEADHLKATILESEKCLAEYNNKHCFSNFLEFADRVKYVSVSEKWSVVPKKSCVLFIYIDLEETVHSATYTYFTVSEDLKVRIFFKGAEITMKEAPKAVASTHDIECVMKNAEILINRGNDNIDYTSIIVDLLDNVVCQGNKAKAISFLKSQILLTTQVKECHKFDFETMIFSSLLYLISRQAYKFVRNSSCLILPHPNTIKNMVSNINISTENFLSYIKDKKCFLKPLDLTVNLMVDEIHIKPYLDYKGGNIAGMAYDSTHIATTAQAFMIQSIMSPFKDVVHILPVNKIDYAALFSVIRQVILGLEDIGFKVVSITADNNRINRKAVSCFANPPKESIVYPNPRDSSRPLFFLHDSVHILKCIRNNWLNLKNEGLTFCYPDFDDPAVIRHASFAAVRALFTIEREKICKFGYGLCVKALWPSSFEKQNVKLVLKIFNEYVASALLELGQENGLINYQDTAKFINIISTWWSIMNVKTPLKGHRLNNEMQKPLTNDQGDVRYEFLQKFLSWLDNWQLLDVNGKLTKETHSAVSLTTYSILEVTGYCANELKMSYILPGKFQTDTLEARFGLYRQLAGSQYNVSMRQIFEAEKKLRLQSTLSLNLRGSLGKKLTIGTILEGETVPKSPGETVFQSKIDITVTVDEINGVTPDLPVITYITGYCCYCVLKRLKCEKCTDFLTLDKEMACGLEYKLTEKLDRGKLCFPRKAPVSLVIFTFVFLKKVLESEKESDFLKLGNVRHEAFHLISGQVSSNTEFEIDSPCTHHSVMEIWNKIIWIGVNIILNNYCKMKNDTVESSKSKKRKLSTFNKT